MDVSEILERIELGEDSRTQFKVNIRNHTSLAEEMVAFSNAAGGLLIVGVDDHGIIVGLSSDDIRRLNNLISNAASEQVKPPINPMTTTVRVDDKILMLIEIRQGISKPYSTNGGAYITKSGADKRRISQEELQRLFQESQRIHADEMVVPGSTISDIDSQELRQYYEKEYGDILTDPNMETNQFLENLYLAKNGQLTLAGLLLFGKKPQARKPTFMIKAISFMGIDLYETLYRDSQDITGNIPELYREGLSFLMRNLRRVQGDKGFNSIGDLEVPKIVLEELLVNALVHRDYFIEAPINLFIFDDRIEIISPGKLPNNLSVENIKHGISVIRNPIITSFAAKMLPYRGIGSGIVRALKNYRQIEFLNDRETERFSVVIRRDSGL